MRPRIRFVRPREKKNKGLRIKRTDAEAQGLQMRSNLLVEQSIQTSNHEN